MCLGGEILMETLIAWSLGSLRWEPITLCINPKTDRGIARNQAEEEVDIFQFEVNGKSYWAIDDVNQSKHRP